LFGDVLVEDMTSINESERERKEVLEELKNSSLPDSVKNWAIENPEKFKKHINEIKKLLGK
jgi:hypothetical protein